MTKDKQIPPPLPSGHYAPAIQDRPEHYSPMLQGPATNTLAFSNTKKELFTPDTITNVATLQKGKLTLFIDAYNDITGGLRTSTKKLLDALAIRLTKQTDYRGSMLPPTEIVFPLEEYMELCGMKITKSSKDELRKKIKEDLDILYHTSIEWDGATDEKKGEFLKTRICSKVGFKSGNILFSFALDMAMYLQNSYLMQYPNVLFKLDMRNPNLWPIGRKLALHNSMDNNRAAGTANTLSVKALLEAAPEIPSYEDVSISDRHYTKRIIKPLETCLDQLVDTNFLSEWTYWNARKTPFTDAQLQNMDYETFSTAYIHFSMYAETPDQTLRLENKKARTTKKS